MEVAMAFLIGILLGWLLHTPSPRKAHVSLKILKAAYEAGLREGARQTIQAWHSAIQGTKADDDTKMN